MLNKEIIDTIISIFFIYECVFFGSVAVAYFLMDFKQATVDSTCYYSSESYDSDDQNDEDIN